MHTLYQNITSRAYIPRYSRVSFMSAFLMLAYGFNSAVGTNLSLGWYYIHPAVSYIDIVVLMNFVLLLNIKSDQFSISTSRVEKTQAYFIATLASLLIISTCINAYRFETHLADMLPAIKLLSFIALIHVIKNHTERFGVVFLINGFFIGVVAVVLPSIFQSKVAIYGFPILWNPNVIGATIALGVFLASLSMAFGRNVLLPLLFALFFLGASIMTWSKGTWLMSAVGFLLVFLFLIDFLWARKRLNYKKKFYRLFCAVLFLMMISYAVIINYEAVQGILDAKIKSTENIGSVGHRFKLIIASIYAGIQNPLFGLGFRNFFQVQNYSPELNLPLMDPSWNAHNVFFQTLATAGFPAFLTLLAIIIFPFVVLKRVIYQKYGVGLISFIVVIFSFGIWAVYGFVQLQLLAQPPFWFFCGLIFGVYSWNCPKIKNL